PISKRRAEICPRNAKQGRQVEKNRLGNEDGANGLIVQRLPRGLVTTVVELTFSIANMVDAERTFTVISSEDFDGTINW
ncbi:hypothetical protein, partial [Pseudomonas savastanoi]|uniref:hypothetical protein n=1 Tax=Pseudomonas savastanoi TaxID=29438 RepID=UPI003F73BD32